jgi:hypothetical protein
VATRESLREVPEIVLAQQGYWAREPDLHPAIDENVFQPLRALIALMNEFAVTPEGVAEEQDRRR